MCRGQAVLRLFSQSFGHCALAWGCRGRRKSPFGELLKALIQADAGVASWPHCASTHPRRPTLTDFTRHKHRGHAQSTRPGRRRRVAFARMSRSIWTWRNCRRGRTSSSRSTVVRPSLPGRGLPSSMADWPTQLVMDWAVTPNSRESCAGERPARTSSTICSATNQC
jgi:hypothetical protein